MATESRDPFVDVIAAARRAYPFPCEYRALVEGCAKGVLALLFPHFMPEVRGAIADVEQDIAALRAQLEQTLEGAGPEPASVLTARFMARLPVVREMLMRDAQAIADGDPAAEELDEVILAYPGFIAVAHQRVAHELYMMRVPILPRLLTEYAHTLTGIDIHPGAQIGASFSIDHGTGIVIGESAVIGDRVRLFQGVTLGALMVSKQLAGAKRHPTIGNDVVIYSGATILGGKTVIGDGCVIGGNTWITTSVPPKTVVTEQSPVRRSKAADEELLDFVI
jgi:serine O-acetyltransferase